MLTSYNTTFHVDFLREFHKGLAREFEESLGADDAAPVHEAEACGALAEPIFVGDAGAMPDDAGVVDI